MKKIKKLFARVAALCLAAAMACTALISGISATLYEVPSDQANPGFTSSSGMWLVQIYNQGNAEEAKPTIDYGINVEEIRSAEITIQAVEAEKGDLDWFEGSFGGCIVLSSNGGDYAEVYGDTIDETYNRKVVDVKNWTGMEYWGTIDEELGIDTIDNTDPVQFVKTGDYTYTATFEFLDSVIPSKGAGCVQLAIQEWGQDMCPIIVKSAVLIDADGNALISFDENGKATVGASDEFTSGDYKCKMLDDGTVEITDYTGSATTLSIPAKIDGKSVTSIGNEAFDNCSALTSITIPGSVTSIGEYSLGYKYNDSREYEKIPGFKIYCYSGTAGEKYAKENGFAYTLLTHTPKAVTGFKLGGRAADALRLNWTKNTSADGYIIEQYKGGKWVRIAKIAGNATTTYRVTGLAAGTAYKFRMRAYKTSGSTPLYSGYTSTLAARTNPSNVTGLKIGGTAASALRLNWNKNASADGYIIEQYKSGKWVRIAKLTNNATTTYRVTGLAAGTAYKFRMKSYKMSGTTAIYSGYTSTLSARTNPSNVTGLKIGGKAQTALRLNWNKNTSAGGYIVEIYKGGKWVRAAKLTSNATTTYRISGLSKNTTYKFRVKAYKMSGTTALYSGYTAVSGRTTT